MGHYRADRLSVLNDASAGELDRVSGSYIRSWAIGAVVAEHARTVTKSRPVGAAFDLEKSRYNNEMDELQFGKKTKLRYGENPHQEGWFFETDDGAEDSLALQKFQFLQGKELSYNNYLDMDGALYA